MGLTSLKEVGDTSSRCLHPEGTQHPSASPVTVSRVAWAKKDTALPLHCTSQLPQFPPAHLLMVKLTCTADQEGQHKGMLGTCRGEILVLVIAPKIAVDFSLALSFICPSTNVILGFVLTVTTGPSERRVNGE